MKNKNINDPIIKLINEKSTSFDFISGRELKVIRQEKNQQQIINLKPILFHKIFRKRKQYNPTLRP